MWAMDKISVILHKRIFQKLFSAIPRKNYKKIEAGGKLFMAEPEKEEKYIGN
jgi:hypothetical protein